MTPRTIKPAAVKAPTVDLKIVRKAAKALATAKKPKTSVKPRSTAQPAAAPSPSL
jgi:hypothetical protein